MDVLVHYAVRRRRGQVDLGSQRVACLRLPDETTLCALVAMAQRVNLADVVVIRSDFNPPTRGR